MAGIVVNGEPRDLDGVPLHTNALDFLRGCGLTGAKEGCAEGECGACSVLVARPAPDGSEATEWTAINSCLVAGRGARRPGGRHRRGARHARRPAPGPARDGGARRLAVRLLHARVRLHAWPRSSTAPAGRPPTARPGTRRRLPRRERLRPARRQRQPVPLHRLPADQGRGVRARLPGRRRRARGPPYDARRRRPWPPGCTTARPTFLRPRRPGRGAAAAARPRGRRRRSPAAPTGVSRSTCAGARAGLVVAVDRLAELRGFSVTDATRSRIGAGLTLTEVERRLDGRLPLLLGADAAVRLAADPQRRHPRRQPRHRLADRRRPAGAARARRRRRAGLDRRGAHGAAGRLLHRLPRVRPPPGRADHRGGRAAAGAPS